MKPIGLTNLARGFFALLLSPVASLAQVLAAPLAGPAAPREGVGGGIAALVVPLVLLVLI